MQTKKFDVRLRCVQQTFVKVGIRTPQKNKCKCSLMLAPISLVLCNLCHKKSGPPPPMRDVIHVKL